MGAGARVGNFVEMKQATLGEGAKINHLSYVGDASVGPQANIGAGTITCNYDGFAKHRTEIGAGAFIGSNSALVAPVSVGAGAIVGAGSVITKDVEADALAITRASQKGLAGWAARFRARPARKEVRRAPARRSEAAATPDCGRACATTPRRPSHRGPAMTARQASAGCGRQGRRSRPNGPRKRRRRDGC